MKQFSFGLVTGIVGAGLIAALAFQALKQPDEPVYLVGAVTVHDQGRLTEYRAIAEPLARSVSSYVPLAFAKPDMIEGTQLTEGLYFVERYDSQADLDRFLESLGESGALSIRDEAAEVHFMLTLPAYGQ